MSPLAMSGHAEWMPGIPAGSKDLIDSSTGPVIYSVGTSLLLVVMFIFRRFFVQPAVAWTLLNLSLLLMGLSMTDSDFCADRHQAGQRADRGADVPAGLLHLAGDGAGGGQRRADRARACRRWRSWTTRRCWCGPTWSTPS